MKTSKGVIRQGSCVMDSPGNLLATPHAEFVQRSIALRFVDASFVRLDWAVLFERLMDYLRWGKGFMS